MDVSTTTAEPIALDPRRSLIGLISEHRELAIQLAEHLDLLVIESDPLSGTSVLLSMTLDDADRPTLAIDARSTGDALDLAMAIATAAVTRLAPQAASWWNSTSTIDIEGLSLSHALAGQGVNLDDLRLGAGSGTEQLRHALELAAALSAGPALVAIDHLDDLLERLNAQASRELLGALRADHQRAGSVQQLLVGRTDGRLASALRDPGHPLYRAGPILRVRRPRPQRFIDDLAIGRAWTTVPDDVIAAAAELAAGAPAYVWRTLDAVTTSTGHPGARVLDAWRHLRQATEPATAQQFRLLASTHRAAPTVVCAIALGVGPYELPLNPKSVNDALTRMRARGQVFSPEKQRWAVSDPLLGAWAREHAPIWVYRHAHAG
ncbi:MAG TPA: hypothetical protein VIJ51_09745 [Solirubrobacteraceae bacterium]